MVNTSLIIFMIVTVILLFVSMVLSAMASNDAKNKPQDCHKYSMWSALVTGIAVGAVVVIMILYIYSSRKDIASAAQQQLLAAHGALGGLSGNPGNVGMGGGHMMGAHVEM